MTREMSARHCANVRLLPCLRCGRHPAGTIHHLKQDTGERGGAMRSSDRWGVPLCWLPCHAMIEGVGSRLEIETFRTWGIPDVLRVARELWDARDSIERMFVVVQHHRAGLPL